MSPDQFIGTIASLSKNGEYLDGVSFEASPDDASETLDRLIDEARAISLSDAGAARQYRLSETDSIYVNRDDRFVVSLIVSYPGKVRSAKRAAAWALSLTQDEACSGSRWFVFDRRTGRMHDFEQREFQDLVAP